MGWEGRVKQAAPYKPLLDLHEFIGYESGLTMQALPYDWRVDATINKKFHRMMKNSLYNLKRVTGKKVNIIAHSYGNINVYFNLYKHFDDYKEREKIVNNYIALTPPFGGTIVGTQALIGGNKFFPVELKGFWGDMILGPMATSMIGSLLTNILGSEWDHQYVKNITQHMRYEESLTSNSTKIEEKGINFWPDANEKCSSNMGISDDCFLRLFNQSDIPIVTINNTKYKAKEVRPLIEESAYFENIKD